MTVGDAQTNFTRDCAGTYDSQSGFHSCVWSDPNVEWSCSGPAADAAVPPVVAPPSGSGGGVVVDGRCTGASADGLIEAEDNFTRDCDGTYDSQSGLHVCNWSDAAISWTCSGPAAESPSPDPDSDPTLKPVPDPNPSPNASACNGTERFFDGFDEESLNPALWKTGFYWDAPGEASNFAGGDQTYAISMGDPVFDVSDSVLSITPRRVGDQHFSGALTAQQDGRNFTSPKGCFEIRARFPDRLGAFPAFWFIANHGPDWTTPGYEAESDYRPEVDVFETIGEPDVFYTTAHHLGSASSHDVQVPSNNWNTAPNITSEFHTFSTRWDDNRVTWYLDGQEIKRVDNSPYVDSMFMHLNYALGNGGWAIDIDNSFFDGGAPALEVDYVKVTS